MASFTLPAFICVAVLSSMTLAKGARIRLCQGPCPEGWVYHHHRCYQHVAKRKTWLGAELNCLRLGGNLVSEHNEDQHEFLKELHKSHDPKNGPFWIGLSDIHKEKKWLWSDGTSASFLKWNAREPNNAGGKEDCVHSNFGGQKDWNDVRCNAKFPSICARGIKSFRKKETFGPKLPIELTSSPVHGQTKIDHVQSTSHPKRETFGPKLPIELTSSPEQGEAKINHVQSTSHPKRETFGPKLPIELTSSPEQGEAKINHVQSTSHPKTETFGPKLPIELTSSPEQGEAKINHVQSTSHPKRETFGRNQLIELIMMLIEHDF